MADRRYYTEGSSARQLNYDDRAGRNRSREAVVRGSAAPARRPQPSVRPERAPQPARRKKQGSSHLTDRERRELATRKAQRKAVTNAQIRYTAGMVLCDNRCGGAVLLSSETYIRCQVTEGVSGNAEEPGGNTA